MHINIDEILVSRGKTRYWLSKQINVTYPTIMKICNNEITSIKLENIENMCKVLNCTPNDILKIEED